MVHRSFADLNDPNYIRHWEKQNHKYVKKYKKNGRWYYVYDHEVGSNETKGETKGEAVYRDKFYGGSRVYNNPHVDSSKSRAERVEEYKRIAREKSNITDPNNYSRDYPVTPEEVALVDWIQKNVKDGLTDSDYRNPKMKMEVDKSLRNILNDIDEKPMAQRRSRSSRDVDDMVRILDKNKVNYKSYRHRKK